MSKAADFGATVPAEQGNWDAILRSVALLSQDARFRLDVVLEIRCPLCATEGSPTWWRESLWDEFRVDADGRLIASATCVVAGHGRFSVSLPDPSTRATWVDERTAK